MDFLDEFNVPEGEVKKYRVLRQMTITHYVEVDALSHEDAQACVEERPESTLQWKIDPEDAMSFDYTAIEIKDEDDEGH